MEFKNGDRIIITERTAYIKAGVILDVGNTGMIIKEEDPEIRGVVRVEMDYDEYYIDQPQGSAIFTFWGPFELSISKSRIKNDVKQNRDNKIKAILDE